MINHHNENSNRTLYSIGNDASRYTWAGYFFFVLISSFIGDTTILVASAKYRAFKLHKVIIVIIQHIAFCDLMVSLTDILPRFVSVVANEWALGNFFCHFNSNASYYFNLVSMLLICTMTSSKLFLLKYPLLSGTITLKKAHLVCVTSWLLSLTVPVTFLLVDGLDVYFSYKTYQCAHGYSSDVWNWLRPSFAALFGFIPIGLVVATTTCLLMTARHVAQRSQESLKWQGIVTTSLVAIFYCISLLPYFVYRAGESLVKADDRNSEYFHTYFFRVANSFISLNTISNFYIYSLTVHSFRRFVWSRIQLFYQFCNCCGTLTNHGKEKTVLLICVKLSSSKWHPRTQLYLWQFRKSKLICIRFTKSKSQHLCI